MKQVLSTVAMMAIAVAISSPVFAGDDNNFELVGWAMVNAIAQQQPTAALAPKEIDLTISYANRDNSVTRCWEMVRVGKTYDNFVHDLLCTPKSVAKLPPEVQVGVTGKITEFRTSQKR